MEHDVCLAEQPDRADREEVWRARSRAHKIDGSRPAGLHHCTMPAATVWLVASSMRISAPVACTDSYASTNNSACSERRARTISFAPTPPSDATYCIVP